jgi:hypothetical protein
MYTITRKNRIREQLQLCHADGSVALTVDVDLNVDEIQARAVQAYKEIGKVQEQIRRAPGSTEAMEAYGNAAIALFNVIFGEEGTRKILAFYEDHYTEMLLDVFPFINSEIFPKIAEASAARRAQLMETARAVKHAKRGGFFK